MGTTIAFILTLMFSAEEQGTARCASIRDHDDRMTCYAIATKNSSYCHIVRDHDKRMKCYAFLGK